MTLAQIIGRNIRRRREVAGLTQKELAIRADLDQGAISQYERGVVEPSLRSFVKLTYALGVGPRDLLPGLEWDPKEGA